MSIYPFSDKWLLAAPPANYCSLPGPNLTQEMLLHFVDILVSKYSSFTAWILRKPKHRPQALFVGFHAASACYLTVAPGTLGSGQCAYTIWDHKLCMVPLLISWTFRFFSKRNTSYRALENWRIDLQNTRTPLTVYSSEQIFADYYYVLSVESPGVIPGCPIIIEL